MKDEPEPSWLVVPYWMCLHGGAGDSIFHSWEKTQNTIAGAIDYFQDHQLARFESDHRSCLLPNFLESLLPPFLSRPQPLPSKHPEQTTKLSCAVSHGMEHNREYEAMDQEMFHVRWGKEESRAKVNAR